jgi:putative endonuclease
MIYVYVLESVAEPKCLYVGSTEDLTTRMTDHNAGRSRHTAKYRPWKLVWYSAFVSRAKAEAFERYLKTASGRAFQKKRL